MLRPFLWFLQMNFQVSFDLRNFSGSFTWSYFCPHSFPTDFTSIIIDYCRFKSKANASSAGCHFSPQSVRMSPPPIVVVHVRPADYIRHAHTHTHTHAHAHAHIHSRTRAPTHAILDLFHKELCLCSPIQIL